MKQENLAFIFPGQGSQKIGMLADLHSAFPVVKSVYDRASEVLGYDLWALSQEGEQEDINLTERTQPLLLTASFAMWQVWNELGGPQPSYMAGHSLGEWSALVCAGVIAFEDAVNIVRLRGKYMQEAVPAGEGAMAAIIGLDDEVVASACEAAREQGEVSLANFNSPGQLVIAGRKEAVQSAVDRCNEAGARKAMLLPVSAPFHTELMKPAADRLSKDLDSVLFVNPSLPIIHNVHAQAEMEPDNIKSIMLEQIYKPVGWVACVKSLTTLGCDVAIECGPGKVLAGLVKRIDKGLAVKNVDSPSLISTAIESVS
ncbi:ACP S-malonyltransferase [Marinibactrum halimedae]|uniref:Malonyl CoA-acyl carrier protein transacylase n=1 Tax=Marinibactrum halimedae TaxID=1444977 RepID=A0AA37WMP1_9GAMM|nr:ACP S-malonyltransferase [Marinibactrum halimedae]MCD9460109.1 ACP S-malonyltransferase [Marinibactrum halimedae]GLS26510.1 malonyl CoA-acyl carrier protein transacylase [Marinibactrum halimedae]